MRGWSVPTPIQRRVVPLMLKGKSVVASAPTGTGKTAAYALPLLHKAHEIRSRARHEDWPEAQGTSQPHALVIVPVPELAVQVTQQMHALCENFPEGHLRITAAAHGTPVGHQEHLLSAGGAADVLIATPSRLVELVATDCLDLSQLRLVVIDECERLLQLDLLPVMLDVYRCIPKPQKGERPVQAVLLSATLPEEVIHLSKRFAPRHVSVSLNKNHHMPRTVKHIVYTVSNRRKVALLVYLLRRKASLRDQRVLVFVRTTQRADRIASRLQELGFAAAPLHSQLSSSKRGKVVQNFLDGDLKVVIATDAASRGLDVPELDYVVNLDIPSEPRDYVHRAGRTGRAGRKGTTLNLVAREPQLIELRGRTVELSERHFLGAIESDTGVKMERRKVAGPWTDSETPVLDWDRAKSHEEAMKLAEVSNSEPGMRENATLRHIESGKYETAIRRINEKRALKGQVIKPVRKKKSTRAKGRTWVHAFT